MSVVEVIVLVMAIDVFADLFVLNGFLVCLAQGLLNDQLIW